MSRFEAVSIALLAATGLSMPPPQEPRSSVREYVTVEGTVERADSSTRVLTLRTGANTTQTISVPREFKLFDDLRKGDRIRVRVSESVIVAVRPGAKPSVPVETTPDATPRTPSAGSGVVQQLKAAVTVEKVDPAARTIVYRTADSRTVVRSVADPKLLEGLKPRDVIEITYTREGAIDLQRAR